MNSWRLFLIVYIGFVILIIGECIAFWVFSNYALALGLAIGSTIFLIVDVIVLIGLWQESKSKHSIGNIAFS